MNDTITAQRGDTLRFRITLFQGAREDGVRVDLTGATVRSAIDVPAHHVFPAPALQVLDAAQGELIVHFTAEKTLSMAKGRSHPLRLALDFPGGDTEVFGPIWINLL